MAGHRIHEGQACGFVHHYCLVNDLPSLLWVVNLATIELHPFLSVAPDTDRPTTIVFDLDPGPPAGLRDCCIVALRIREILDRHGLVGWPKTSGALGLHVYVPVRGAWTFESPNGSREISRGASRRRSPTA